MAKVLFAAAYAAVALYFLRGYLPRPTLFDVIASLLWPLALAVTLAWLMMLDDDALSGRRLLAQASSITLRLVGAMVKNIEGVDRRAGWAHSVAESGYSRGPLRQERGRRCHWPKGRC